ncbi:MAG TPA: DUF2946 domain-containing protein [Methylophilaceae bacterium]|jgi:hypothetical protein
MFSGLISAKVKSKAASWIAIAAVLVASFAPTISNALAAKSKTPWQEICSVQGIKYIPAISGGLSKVTQNQAPQQDGRILHMEHCPYCFMHAGSVGLILDNSPVIAQLNLKLLFPRLFYQSPYPLFAWVSSNPRAPPVVS